MRRRAALGCALAAAALVLPATASAAAHYTHIHAFTTGTEMQVNLTEVGLKPGQNYAYSGSAEQASEVFQCYHSNSFTPGAKIYVLTSANTFGTPFGFTANADGVVHGRFLVDAVMPTPPRRDRCPAGQEPVPIFISFTNYDVVNINSGDFRDINRTVSGPVEPD